MHCFKAGISSLHHIYISSHYTGLLPKFFLQQRAGFDCLDRIGSSLPLIILKR